MADPQTTAEEIVRLLVEELGDPGRVKPIYDSWNAHVGESYQLSNPLKRMAQEWIATHG